jgi:hypothetical protein
LSLQFQNIKLFYAVVYYIIFALFRAVDDIIDYGYMTVNEMLTSGVKPNAYLASCERFTGTLVVPPAALTAPVILKATSP